MTTSNETKRRTPAEIARDDLKAQMDKVEQAEEQVVRRVQIVGTAQERIRGALRRADYLVNNPDLPEEAAAAYAEWRKEHDVAAPAEPDEPTPAEEAAWKAGATEVLSQVAARLGGTEDGDGPSGVVDAVAEEYGLDLVIIAEVVKE